MNCGVELFFFGGYQPILSKLKKQCTLKQNFTALV